MAGSTPTRDARSSRLGSKPYDRPSSASSSAANTPNKAAGGGGLLRSLVGKLYSPFGPKLRESVTNGKERIQEDSERNDERKQVQRSSEYTEKNGDSRDTTGESDNKMEFEEEDYQPIRPIQQAIESLQPITPEHSTRLLAQFMMDKQAYGQAGQQTPEEQQAISELLRRATEDSGKPSILGESGKDGAARSLSVSRTGRGLFNSPVREKGFVRSSSYDILSGSPSRNRASVRPNQGSPARSWRPLHASTLAQSQSKENNESSIQQSQSNLFQPQRIAAQSSNEQSSSHKSSNMPFASRQPSSLSKSTSIIVWITIDVQTKRTLSPSSAFTAKIDKVAGQSSSPSIKSAAARTLENLLSKAEAESDKKFNVEPISNPYEGYRFHIGSTSTPFVGTSRQPVTSSSSRPRTSLKPRARASLGGSEHVPDTSKMSDLDLITASWQAEQTNKRIRKSSPAAVSKGKSSEQSSDRMQVDESPIPRNSSRASASSTAPTRSSYSILERPQSPVKPPVGKSFSQDAQSTTPKQPPSTKSSAFDIISRTIAASAPTEQTPRTSVSFASLPTSEPAKLPEQSEILTSANQQPKIQTPDELVRRLDASALPVNTFRSLTGGEDLGKDTSALARQQALTTKSDKLPRFTFTFRMSETSTATATFAAAPPSTGFTGWGSGMTPQAGKGGNDMWECSTCMCKSPLTSTKCDVCSEPQPAAKVALSTASVGFTGWGSGAAPPSTSTDQWTCSLCMCKTASTSTKCEVCEAPRADGAAVLPKAAHVGFTGWGAGAQDKVKPASTWTCSTCQLQSKDSSSKCEMLDAKMQYNEMQ
ncbi:hypothetical protein QFC21_005958 [Naganishia friedmannii]|uniref:Uncharacterized protein n=1 Tax=Naganishia friedmannii TaxID=89922 RepID=A0ACC2V4Z3_9TREE|nr:hypothetical protein QFC21_005958 [Naganishia friedmannii]